jgi:hypothetical protein
MIWLISGGKPSDSRLGITKGMQRNTAAMEPRCLEAEAAHARDADADVELAGVLELLHLLRGQQLGQQLARLVGGEQLVRQLQDLAVDLDEDRRVRRHVDVGGALLRHQPQHAFQVVRHGRSFRWRCRGLRRAAAR